MLHALQISTLLEYNKMIVIYTFLIKSLLMGHYALQALPECPKGSVCSHLKQQDDRKKSFNGLYTKCYFQKQQLELILFVR